MAAPSIMTLSTCVFLGFLVVCSFSVANGEGLQGEGGAPRSVDFTGEMTGQGFAAPSRKMLATPSVTPYGIGVAPALTVGVPAHVGPCALCHPHSECVGQVWWC